MFVSIKLSKVHANTYPGQARLSRSGGRVGGWLGCWVAGWVAGWLRKAENKTKAQQSWGLGFAEIGNINDNDENISVDNIKIISK